MSTVTASKPKAVRKVQSAKDPVSEAPARKVPAAEKSESKLLTTDAIGDVAGAVWNCLNSEGPQSLAKLKKSLDAPSDTVLAAIGWLAREGKLSFETSGKAVTVSLG